MARIITLLTDFGLQDGYVASMKGIILSICPEAQLVDITHLIPAQDVRSAAFVLAVACQDFPRTTVHLAVVDPGVGTKRRALAVRTSRHVFVGPDNGLFSWILKEEPGAEACCLDNIEYWRTPVSSTFHGRDIFAPVAAHLAAGVSFHSTGSPCIPVTARWCTISRSGDALHGEAIHIDHFGNIVTNITRKDLLAFSAQRDCTVKVGDHIIPCCCTTYGDASHGAPVALIGSSGHLEVAVNMGNAAKSLNIQRGNSVTVFLPPRKHS